ncbi:hypothetical protein GCM10010109_85190 [Actinoplanes campanulatus]|nr:hypothetical protein GCM10010109_85190 [Actinoplanes campanulatus]GID40486.1 hypothetical protein Aca09nite_69920 [Actinoplanes campanulatus]
MQFGLYFLVGLVDPDLVGQVEDLGQWPTGAEPLRMRGASRGEGVLAAGADLVVAAVVHVGGVCRPIPECRWAWLYQFTNSVMNERASARDANRSGKTGAYLSVLNQASLYGLSLEVFGRECDRVT